MYKQNKMTETTLEVNASYEGERIEEKIERIMNNKEPISDGAPLVYTDRKDGVQPGYNIRTDRFEIAIDAMDVVTKQHQAKRKERADLKIVKDEPKNDKEGNIGGAEPIQGSK